MSDFIPNFKQQRIFLIRHARPLVKKKGFFSAAAARQYISDYDAAEVEQFVLRNEAIPYQEIKRVYCSTLVRSQLTAKAIFGEDTELIIDHNFREFERRIFSLPLLRLPIKLWLFSARMLWFFGLNSRDIERFKEAKQRVKKCASLLEKEAFEQGYAVLVAHGLLNNFLIKELKKRGWHQTTKGGAGFVSVNVLQQS